MRGKEKRRKNKEKGGKSKEEKGDITWKSIDCGTSSKFTQHTST